MTNTPITPSNEMVAVQKDISYIQKDIADIKGSIKELTGVYITKLQFEDAQKSFEARVAGLEKNSNLWRWLSPTLSAALSSVITFLIVNYLQGIK